LVNSPLPTTTTTTTTTRHDTTPTPTLVAQSTPTRTPLHVTSTTRSGGESRLRLTHQLEGCRSVENFEKIGQIGTISLYHSHSHTHTHTLLSSHVHIFHTF
jgi:hypothetical protein